MINKKVLDSIADKQIRDGVESILGCLVETYLMLSDGLSKMDQSQIDKGREKINNDEDIFAYMRASTAQRALLMMGHLIRTHIPLYNEKVQIIKLFIDQNIKDYDNQEGNE